MPKNREDRARSNAPSIDQLEYRLAQQEALVDFSAFVLEMPGEDALFREACRITTVALSVDHAKVLKYRPQHNDLLIIEGMGWREGVIGEASLGANDGSPAGFAFSNQVAVLSVDLEKEKRFRRPELLEQHGIRQAINVGLERGDERFGVLEADSTSAERFTEPDFSFLRSLANILCAAMLRQKAEDDLTVSRNQERTLRAEMEHRVKNLFSVVMALMTLSDHEARQSERSSDAIALARERVMALSRAGQWFMSFGRKDTQEGSIAEDTTSAVLEPYGKRIRIQTPQPPIPANAATPLALILHELATNSVKYGALSTQRGFIDIEWAVDHDMISMDWREFEGPAIEGPPIKTGFGRRLIEGVLAEIDGTIEREWLHTGLHAVVSFPAGRG
ncbi:MAG: GAF domain-containing protein [Ahrensia sp.]|nr:GAF domain-containing protein [Ahrensia sp.]